MNTAAGAGQRSADLFGGQSLRLRAARNTKPQPDQIDCKLIERADQKKESRKQHQLVLDEHEPLSRREFSRWQLRPLYCPGA